MRFYKNLVNSGEGPYIVQYPAYGGGANIEEGAVVVKGATPGTNQGFVILPANLASNLANVVGVIGAQNANTSAGVDNIQAGTVYSTKPVMINPDAIYLAEYSQAAGDLLTVVSTSGTTVTIASLEDDIDGGWLYAVAGTGIGQLQYITTAAAGSCTTKTATGWDNTTRVIKILPRFHENAILSDAGRKLGTQAAVGGTGYVVLENMIEADSVPAAILNPLAHSGLTGLHLLNVKLASQIHFQAYVGNI